MDSLFDMLRTITLPSPRPMTPATVDLISTLLELEPAHPNSNLAKMCAESGVQRSYELERILQLPRRDPDEVVDVTEKYISLQGCPGCDLCISFEGAKLRPVQSRILFEAEQMGGVFAGAGVGSGKTLSTLLLPTALGGGLSVLLIKPSLVPQLLDDAVRYGRHFKIPTQLIYIVTYHDLSSASKRSILDELKPKTIVADEVHLLARQSARSSRFWRFFKENPATYFAGLTGSMMRDSILNYAKFMDLALGKSSPVPVHPELRNWANALDEPKDGGSAKMAPGALTLFCNEGETVAQGFQRRLRETPGVIITKGDEGVDASLEIRAVPVPEPPEVKKALKYLNELWAWDGIELDEAMSKARVERQLVLGFFYRIDWDKVGGRDEEWLAARNAWNREVRNTLQHGSREDFDSALLLTNAARKGEWASETWAAWEPLMNRYKPEPPNVAVWIDDSIARAVADWAQQAPGLVWCWHEAFAAKVAELTGPTALRFEAGMAKELLAYAQSKYAGETSLILSGDAYSEGQNLQAWSRALITSVPSSALRWQQTIGREHRPGQLADTVTVDVLWNPTHEAAWHAAVKNARGIYETTGQVQKILYADLVGLSRDATRVVAAPVVSQSVTAFLRRR